MKATVLRNLLGMLLVPVLFACSAKIEGGSNEPEVTGPPAPSSGPLAGQLNGQPWKITSGQATRYLSSSGSEMLELVFWDDPHRVPCASVSPDDQGKAIYLVAHARTGETRHQFGSATKETSFYFGYPGESGRTYRMGTMGSSFIDVIDDWRVKGHLAVGGGTGFAASGVYSVRLCR